MALRDIQDGKVGSIVDSMIEMHGTVIWSPSAAKNARFGLANYIKDVTDVLKAREDAEAARQDKVQMDIEEEVAKEAEKAGDTPARVDSGDDPFALRKSSGS